MVSQIIISQEDSTSFFSIGSIQNDATLVSALGGALSSFAVEIGLSDNEMSQANYSKFKNGILISKWLTIGTHHPMLMIAVRGLKDLASYHQMFLLEYGTLLAERILSKFEKTYESQGAVPKFAEGVKVLPGVAHSLFKSSPATLKEFSQFIAPSCQAFLEELWDKQHEKKFPLKSFQRELFSPSKAAQFLDEFVLFFYQEGTRNDALFPLNFASAPDLSVAKKYVQDFLLKRATRSRRELSEAIVATVRQLQQFSASRRPKKRVSLSGIDLFNANVLFEQLAVIKRSSFEKERQKILSNLFTTIYQKLFKKYPLKFLAVNLLDPLTVDFVRKTFMKEATQLLKFSLKKELFSHQLFLLLRELSSQYSPEEVMRNSEAILSAVKEKFIASVPKIYPFLALVDSNLVQTRRLLETLARGAFKQYQIAHDEAMALWYILRNINRRVQQQKSASFSNRTRVFFLQKLIRKYQFRPVPDLFYTLCQRILSNIAKTVKTVSDPVYSLVQRHIQSLEKESSIMIPKETSDAILKKIKRIQATQKFENIEALSYFSKAFSYALEDTIVKVLEEFFGTIKQPSAPQLLQESLQAIILHSNILYQMARFFQEIRQRSGFQTLVTTEAKKILIKTFSLETVLPSTFEIIKIAYRHKFFIPVQNGQKEKANATALEKMTKNQLLSLVVKVPELSLSGSVSSLLKEPTVQQVLLFKFFEEALFMRHRQLASEAKKIEQQLKRASQNSTEKKSLAQTLKSLKKLSHAYKSLITGGRPVQRLFTGRKSLKKVISGCSKELFPAFSRKPFSHTFPLNGVNTLLRSDSQQSVSTFGEYKRVVEVYASTWVRDSLFIDKLQEKLLWVLVKKEVEKGSIEAKILSNLEQEASKGERIDQAIIIRKTIEEEVLMLFNHNVRAAIANAFALFSDDLFVKYHSQSKNFLFSIATIPLPLEILSSYFDCLPSCKLVKSSDDITEVALNISSLLPVIISRKKESQPIRSFLFDGMKEFIRSHFLKAFDSLGELVDLYIGQQAADLFYTKSRLFERLVLESIKQS